ncbi:alpha/beta hydrolase [Acidisoma cellulosilytica]|uniref:Alpha/beta hydrolase n=1 Tax=Acidisoma cellulosilyticum TaxID=2802395 RepID=A0A963YZP8_9PROT|nr:alpha/beta hydrolase [Acidisoma cellulosilyticum]MCB8880039.1 alpha/beta hydrolase [Acidisoma cellulosilyticum]
MRHGLQEREQQTAISAPTRRGVTRGMLGLGGLGIVSLVTTACSPLGVLNGMAPRRQAAQDIAYGSDPRQRLDIYVPEGLRSPAPVIVFYYGGSWDSGSKAMYRFVGGALAAQGFVTVIPDYRLYPQVRYPTFLDDCASAFAWTAEHARQWGGSDTQFLMGHSAGAYNAAMLALDLSYLRAAQSRLMPAGTVGIAGPYDFLPLESAELKTIFGFPTAPLTQPINHVDGHNAPMLLLAGTQDTTVLPRNTTRLAARIRDAGGPVSSKLYPGIDHREIIGAIGQPFRFLAPTLSDSVSFLHQTASAKVQPA